MVSNVWISETFEADLHSILNYYCDELGMPTEARRFMEEVDRAKELIAEVPFVHSASNKAGLRERGCREHLVGGYELIYRVEAEGTVLFLRLLHQSQLASRQVIDWGLGAVG